jgi:aminopeptidase N
VAISDFNMGAMENKSLNVFNAKYILADPEISTDADYALIESIVAHEYFHNWTGNRITCRDWFQLSLKEGLTVFRDQQFSADMRSAPVKRIEDVWALRARQFAEDAGPLSHPVRPPSYIEINNFYTATVYEKGAEVVRMLHTLLGAEAYREGIDLYVERHDGEAATCDDFLAAMADASGRDLSQLALWYDVPGTPELTVSGRHHHHDKSYELIVRQSVSSGASDEDGPALHIPLAMGLLDREGKALPETLSRVEELMGHSAFSLTNPNKVRALIGRFAAGNPLRFHAPDGAGYRFLVDRVIELDGINPQVAARLLQPLGRWRRFAPHHQKLMRQALERVLAVPQLSRDVYEIASKSLG